MTGEASTRAGGWPPVRLYCAAWTPLAIAYFIVFLLTSDHSAPIAVLTAFANVVSPFLLGFIVMIVVMKRVFPAGAGEQVAWHVGLSLAFSVCWLVLLTVLLRVLDGLQNGAWRFDPIFSGPALVWQLFQGLVIYFLIVAATYAVWAGRRLEQAAALELPGKADGAHAPHQRVFLRRGEEIVPIEIDDIVCINGADDYSEVATARRTDLARLTLNEFADRLDPAKFKRVHRSHIVNVDKIASMEPRRGGGLRLIMVEGSVVPASRSGAEQLRGYLA